MNAVPLITTAAFITAFAALWVAAVRVASLFGMAGLGRILAAATVVAAATVAESLALGLVQLGGSTIALLVGALALAGVACLKLPAPGIGPAAELAQWWSRLESRWRLATGAAGGVAVAWGLLTLLQPSLDIDSTIYHLSQPAIWINEGRPGSIEQVIPGFPVGNYPLTNEVLLGWMGGLSRNIGTMLLWGVLSVVLLCLAVVTTARAAGASRLNASLALIALVGVPVVGDSITSLDTDLSGATWVMVSVALTMVGSKPGGDRRVLAFAVLAFGLAMGTKTSVAPVGLLALGAGFIAARHSLSRLKIPLAVGFLAALVVGGCWYARNLIQHGNPLWPFVALPGGDALPPGYDSGMRFITRPLATLDGELGNYFQALGLAPLLLVAATLSPLVHGRRGMATAAAVAACIVAWMSAPFTGGGGNALQNEFALSTVRYLMPSIALAAGVLAVVASRPSTARCAAKSVLAVAALWGCIDLLLGRDGIPGALTLLAAAAGGAAAAWALGRAGNTALPARRLRGVLGGVAASLAVAALALYPGIFLDRYSTTTDVENPLEDTRPIFGSLAGWFEGQPAYRDGSRPILFQPRVVGPLAGGTFAHPLALIQPGTPCAEVEAMRDGGWVVLDFPSPGFGGPPDASRCFTGPPVATFPTPSGSELRIYGGPEPR